MIAPTEIDLQQLLIDWYGRESEPSSPLPTEIAWLPDDAKRAFAAASRTMWRYDAPRAFRNLRPDREDPRMKIFLSDPDFDMALALRGSRPDTVHEASWDSPDWSALPEDLPTALKHHFVKTIADDPRFHSAHAVIEDDLAHGALSSMIEIAFTPWKSYPGERIFLGEHVIGIISPAHSGRWPSSHIEGAKRVQFAAKDRGTLDFTADIPAIDGWVRFRPEELPPQVRADLGINKHTPNS
ncbi:hypothetical protein ACI1MP_29380 [Kitasatospora griseola]|uniref:hypothetical protein n=1 Tax=Kitasatospora griseola TaxID=2064 RepID=UPI0038560D87